MAATKQDIEGWFERGVKEGASHLLVIVDTYDHEDYPTFAKTAEECRKIYEEHAAGKHAMQRVMEVYSMKLPKQAQLDEHRAFHFE